MTSEKKPNTTTLSLRSTPRLAQRPAADLLPQEGQLILPPQQPKIMIPKPCAGLVIFYDYTWHTDFKRKGESDKARPCLIMGLRRNPDRPKNPEVAVEPITHTPPSKALKDSTLRIPMHVGQQIGLDNQRSFIRCHELNVFEWPGPDLTPIPGSKRKRVEFGLLDKDLFKDVQQMFAQVGRQLVVRRDPACDLAEHGL